MLYMSAYSHINTQSVQTDSITHLLLDPWGFSTCRGWSHPTQTRCTEEENRWMFRFQFYVEVEETLYFYMYMKERGSPPLRQEEGEEGGLTRSSNPSDLITCVIMGDQTPSSCDMTVWPQPSSCSLSELLWDFVNTWFHLNLSLGVTESGRGVDVICSYARMSWSDMWRQSS